MGDVGQAVSASAIVTVERPPPPPPPSPPTVILQPPVNDEQRPRRIVVPPPPIAALRAGIPAGVTLDEAYSKLGFGAYVFEPPVKVQLGENITSRLLLDPRPVFARTHAEFDRTRAEPGFVAGHQTRISAVMEADLMGKGLQVTTEGVARKDISFDRSTEWFWDVKAIGPESPGSLTLTLSGLLKVAGKERLTPVEPFPIHYEVLISPGKVESPTLSQPPTQKGRPGRPPPRGFPGDGLLSGGTLWILLVAFLVLGSSALAFRARLSGWADKLLLGGRNPAERFVSGVPQQKAVVRDETGFAVLVNIVVIYFHGERNRAQAFCEQLVGPRYRLNLGPAGFPEGSPKWRKYFLDNLGDSDAILVVITAMSLGQRWMNWQIEMAVELQNKRDVPIYVVNLDEKVADVSRTFGLLRGLECYPSTPEGRMELRSILQNADSLATRNLRCFVSYSHHRREFAAKLCADLNRAGVPTWMDVEGIPGGTVWKEKIAEAIELSTHVLFLLTEESVKSSDVTAEIDWALQKHKTVIPIMEQQVDLPFGLVGTQYISFMQGYDAAFRTLLQDLVAAERTYKA